MDITTGEIVEVSHVGTSRDGNPTYRLTLTDGRAYLTETDSASGWSAPNYRPRRHWGQRGLLVTLHLHGQRVTQIEGPDALDLYLGES